MTLAASPRLVYAAISAHEHGILEALGTCFSAVVMEAVEEPKKGESAPEFTRRVATKFATRGLSRDDLILSTYHVAAMEEHILMRAGSSEEATKMLRVLEGKEHRVVAASALNHSSLTEPVVMVDEASVVLAKMTPEEIDWYVSTGEPIGQVGGYSSQGAGAVFVESVSGSHSTSCGLALPTIFRLFLQAGFDLRAYLEPTRYPSITGKAIL